MRKVSTPLFAIAALTTALLSAEAAAAQDPVPQCGGKNATIVLEGWTDSDATAFDDVEGQFGSFEVRGIGATNGDDVIVVKAPGTAVEYVSILGLGGNDTICLEQINPSLFIGIDIHGGDGNDTVYGMPEARFRSAGLFGDAGDDVIHGSNSGDEIEGGSGNDTIYAYGAPADTLNLVWGGSGDDVIRGGAGYDLVFGGTGNDTIYGAQGDDRLLGEGGKDEIFGGSGNDMLLSDEGFQQSIQFDRGDYSPGPFDLTTTTFGSESGGARMFGGPGNDVIIGGKRWDRMQGGPGDDLMLGMEGRDWMRGGAGNDILVGGANIDDVNGNLGADAIVTHGADVGQGGFGNDTCVTAAGSKTNLRSCERAQVPNNQWNRLTAAFDLDWQLR